MPVTEIRGESGEGLRAKIDVRNVAQRYDRYETKEWGAAGQTKRERKRFDGAPVSVLPEEWESECGYKLGEGGGCQQGISQHLSMLNKRVECDESKERTQNVDMATSPQFRLEGSGCQA